MPRTSWPTWSTRSWPRSDRPFDSPSSRAMLRSRTRSRTPSMHPRSWTPSSGRYFAFRRRLRDIAQASQCDCNACSRMPGLDLKILAHHGVIGRQRVAGREELVGSAGHRRPSPAQEHDHRDDRHRGLRAVYRRLPRGRGRDRSRPRSGFASIARPTTSSASSIELGRRPRRGMACGRRADSGDRRAGEHPGHLRVRPALAAVDQLGLHHLAGATTAMAGGRGRRARGDPRRTARRRARRTTASTAGGDRRGDPGLAPRRVPHDALAGADAEHAEDHLHRKSRGDAVRNPRHLSDRATALRQGPHGARGDAAHAGADVQGRGGQPSGGARAPRWRGSPD